MLKIDIIDWSVQDPVIHINGIYFCFDMSRASYTIYHHITCSEPYSSYAQPKPTGKKNQEIKSKNHNDGKSEFFLGFQVSVGFNVHL